MGRVCSIIMGDEKCIQDFALKIRQEECTCRIQGDGKLGRTWTRFIWRRTESSLPCESGNDIFVCIVESQTDGVLFFDKCAAVPLGVFAKRLQFIMCPHIRMEQSALTVQLFLKFVASRF